MRFYFLRHAQSINNAESLDDSVLVYQGLNKRQPDPNITLLGEQQAKAAAQWINENIQQNTDVPPNHKISKIFCSPMVRTLITAKILDDVLDVPVEVNVHLHEQGGIFSGPRSRSPSPGNSPVMEMPFPAGITEKARSSKSPKGLTRSQIAERFSFVSLPLQCQEWGWWKGGRETWKESVTRAHKIASWMWELSTAPTPRKRRRIEECDEDSTSQGSEESPGSVLLIGHGLFSDLVLKCLMQIPLPHVAMQTLGADGEAIPDMEFYLLSGNCSLSCIELLEGPALTSSTAEGGNLLASPTHHKRPHDEFRCHHSGAVGIIYWNRSIIGDVEQTGQSMGNCPRFTV